MGACTGLPTMHQAQAWDRVWGCPVPNVAGDNLQICNSRPTVYRESTVRNELVLMQQHTQISTRHAK